MTFSRRWIKLPVSVETCLINRYNYAIVSSPDPDVDRVRRSARRTARSRVGQSAVALLGIAALAVGGVATFLSSNGAGSAGLVAGGTTLILFVLLGERIESLKVGSVEVHLREVARQLTMRASDLEARGDREGAERLREEAGRLLLQASPAARAYEDLRRTRPPGAQRVIELSKIVDDAHEYSRASHPSAEAVRQIFFSGSDGERVYALALMQADSEVGNLDCILDSITYSHSAFEQGQALLAAIQLVPRVSPADRARLAQAVRDQLRPDGHITRSTDRRRLAEQLLNMLDEQPR